MINIEQWTSGPLAWRNPRKFKFRSHTTKNDLFTCFSHLSCEKNILNDSPAAMWPAAMWLCHVSGPPVHCSMFITDTQFVEWSKRFCDMSLEGSITSDEEDTYKEESPCGRWHRRNVKVNFIYICNFQLIFIRCNKVVIFIFYLSQDPITPLL